MFRFGPPIFWQGQAALAGTGGSAPLSLVAGAGSYLVTGSDASPRFTARILAAAAGSYAVTGIDATINQPSKRIVAGAGSYTISGVDASLLKTSKIAAAAGSYAVTGSDATLSKTSVGLLDGLSPTGAWSMSRDLLTAWVGSGRYTTATGVDSWKDQSGNGRNLDQSSGTLQPAVTTAGPNSRTCADFDGSNDYLGSSGALSTFIANSSGYMIAGFIADAITLADASVFNNHLVIGDAGGFVGLHIKDTAGSPDTIFAYNWDGNADTASSVTMVTATPFVAEWRHEGGNVFIRINAGSWSAGTASGNTSTMTNALRVGGRNGLAAEFNCKIFEAATWSTIPSSGNQDIIAAGFKSWIGA